MGSGRRSKVQIECHQLSGWALKVSSYGMYANGMGGGWHIEKTGGTFSKPKPANTTAAVSKHEGCSQQTPLPHSAGIQDTFSKQVSHAQKAVCELSGCCKHDDRMMGFKTDSYALKQACVA